MAKEVEKSRPLAFKQIGCSAASRATLQEGAYFFADIDSSQLVFLKKPNWVFPERKSSLALLAECVKILAGNAKI
ncbi:MAG: hypothetical protein FWG10_12550 [Eubacteriaceae bacterium]|nr:hypothetical protein [Eubacteriaceae bacterium]